MHIVQVQFAPWDKVYNFSTAGLELVVGDYVIVETEMGKELGKIISCHADKAGTEKEIKPVLRKAEFDDIAGAQDDKKKAEALDFCRQAVERLELPMKLIDVHFSFDGSRINFAFISDGRVDFRELVKELAARLSANIRLTQIGTRDEAKISGDCGPCGRGLCCLS